MGQVIDIVGKGAAAGTPKAHNRQMVKDAFVEIITFGLCNTDQPRTMAAIAEGCGLTEVQLRCMIEHDSWLSVRMLADIASLLDVELAIALRLPERRGAAAASSAIR